MTIDFYVILVKIPIAMFYGGSIVNGDPIAIAKNAPDLDAETFVKYVLSEEGQALWLTIGSTGYLSDKTHLNRNDT